MYFIKSAGCILLLLMSLQTLQAQNVLESLNDTAMVQAGEAPASADPISAKKWNQVKTKYFTLNLGVAMFLDYNTVSQDDENIAQVDKIESATEFRAQFEL